MLDGDDFILADDGHDDNRISCTINFYALMMNILKQLIWWEVDYVGVDFMVG